MRETLLTAAVGFGLCLGCLAGNDNLVQNPGFEDPIEKQYRSWNPKAASFQRDAETARSGKFSMRIDKNSGSKLIVGSVKYAPLKKDAAYTLSGWVKTRGAAAGIAGILRDAEGKYIADNNIWTAVVSGDRDWVYVEKVFNAGGAAQLEPAAMCDGTGTAWYDDLCLREGMPEAANHLCNSSFKICATPGYPDWWGPLLTAPSTVRDWETGDYYGVDKAESSPIPGTSALRFRSLPSPITFTPFTSMTDRLPPGKYTFSVYARSGSGKATLGVSGFSGKRSPFTIPATWERLSFTADRIDKAMMALAIGGPGTIWIAAPQLESGDKLSPWKPSASDAALTPAATGAPPTARAEVELARCPNPPKIDGKLDDPCWAGAWKAPLFVDNKTGATAITPTEAWMSCDADNIHFAFKCSEKDPERRRGVKGGNDTWSSFSKDAVELFIDTGSKDYVHVAVSPAGNLYDEKGRASDWSSGAVVATSVEGDAWIVEASIPIAVLSSEGADSSKPWGLNLCRGREADGKKEYSAAAGPDSFHNPEKFLRVKRMPVDIKPWAFTSAKVFHEQGQPGRFFVFASSPGNAGKEFSAELKSSGAAGKTWERKFTMGANGSALTIEGLPDAIDLDAEMELTIHSAGQTKPTAKFTKRYLHLNSPYDPSSPLKNFLEYSWYPTGSKTARAKVGASLPGKSDVKLTLSRKDSRLWSTTIQLSTTDDSIVEIPIGELAPGSYELWAECVQSGQPVAYAGDRLVILPPKKNSIRMDRFARSFTIDDKPFMPMFFHPYASRVTPKWLFEKCAADGYNSMQSILPLEQANATIGQVDEFVRACDASGMRHLMRPSTRGRGTIEEILKGQDAAIGAAKDSQSILAYFLMDEPGKATWEGRHGFKESDLLRLAEAAHTADPYHPEAVNYTAPSLGSDGIYGGFAASDFLLYDDYPNMSDGAEPLESFAANAKRWNAAGEALGRCVVVVLPVWGSYDAVRTPTPDEWQNMLLTSLIHGTRSYINWMELPYSIPLTKRIRDVNWQIREVSPLILDKATRNIGGRAQGKTHYALWINGSGACLMAANTSSTSAAELELDLDTLAGMELTEKDTPFAEGVAYSFEKGKFKASLPPRKSGIFKFTQKSRWWLLGF